MLLRAAQTEGLLRTSDVSAALADADRPASTGTAHNAIRAEHLPADLSTILLESLDTPTLAYAAARLAGGSYTPPGAGAGSMLVAVSALHSNLTTLLAAAADGKIDDEEAPRVEKALIEARDTIAAQLAALQARRDGK